MNIEINNFRLNTADIEATPHGGTLHDRFLIFWQTDKLEIEDTEFETVDAFPYKEAE